MFENNYIFWQLQVAMIYTLIWIMLYLISPYQSSQRRRQQMRKRMKLALRRVKLALRGV